MTNKPDLGFWKLWNLSFGFFGVQIAYALQSSQVSRIFSTIGADPHDLSYFWILPPLMGLIVQPIVGSASDRTWNRLGRRLPYLVFGALVAIIVMCLLPNAGSLGLTVSSAIIFGLIMLMFLDTSINMAMQPFKMLVGDFVNEKQKGLAYSIQSFLCNAGSVVGYVAPFVLAWFLPNSAPQGEVPLTVTVAFYLGAAILLVCVFYTLAKVKEMPPAEYAAYHGITETTKNEKTKNDNIFKLLVKAPSVFWTVGIVQFFCWAGFLYMWSYSTDAVAIQAFDAPTMTAVDHITVNGADYSGKYLFDGDDMVLDNGRPVLYGLSVDGDAPVTPRLVVINGVDTIVKDGNIFYINGVGALNLDKTTLNTNGLNITFDDQPISADNISAIWRYQAIDSGSKLKLAGMAVLKDGRYDLEEVTDLPSPASPNDFSISTVTKLNPSTPQYQNAGDWNGNLLAVQGLVAVVWALVLARFRNRRTAYSLSLLIGAIGFVSIYFLHNQYLLFISYGLAGCGWAAMLAMPFTILTNALSGKNIGTYLGLFNCTICLPQIIAALLGGLLLSIFPLVSEGPSAGAPNTVFMLVTSGVLLLLGALSVWIVKETTGEAKDTEGDVAAAMYATQKSTSALS
ncbi:MAG: MFS transporter [Muribaculaceae bacterium]|nr:MFS transporter [Muribaculaceae bacterium]